mmetsp:Transcript_30905/g.99714  ORF Transcript_30905/g.99714 Transcript_30905/m.99714 type:complete len:313 (+) Transcript_30905:299-1237(+)
MRLGGVREGGGDGSIDGTRARDDKGRDLEAAGVGDGEEVVEGDEHGDDDGGSHDHGPLEDEVVGDLGFDEAEGFHADLKGDGTEGYDDEEADEMPGGEDGRILGEEVVARREVEVEGGEAEEEVWESGEPREEEREDAEEVLDDRRQSEDADALEPDEGPGAVELQVAGRRVVVREEDGEGRQHHGQGEPEHRHAFGDGARVEALVPEARIDHQGAPRGEEERQRQQPQGLRRRQRRPEDRLYQEPQLEDPQQGERRHELLQRQLAPLLLLVRVLRHRRPRRGGSLPSSTREEEVLFKFGCGTQVGTTKVLG